MRILSVLLLCASLLSAAGSDTADRLKEASEVLRQVMRADDSAIPQDLLDKAECAVVIPGMKKGAFIIGAKYGRGFISCRKGNAGWSAPAGVRLEGGSVGFQIGGSETDLVMLVLNRRGADKLMNSKFTLGADASVAAGPVGRTTTAETDAYMHAEILSWSRTRGAFAGISLKGNTLRPDEDANEDLYGRKLSNKAIVRNDTAVPEMAKPFVAALTKYSARR